MLSNAPCWNSAPLSQSSPGLLCLCTLEREGPLPLEDTKVVYFLWGSPPGHERADLPGVPWASPPPTGLQAPPVGPRLPGSDFGIFPSSAQP